MVDGRRMTRRARPATAQVGWSGVHRRSLPDVAKRHRRLFEGFNDYGVQDGYFFTAVLDVSTSQASTVSTSQASTH